MNANQTSIHITERAIFLASHSTTKAHLFSNRLNERARMKHLHWTFTKFLSIFSLPFSNESRYLCVLCVCMYSLYIYTYVVCLSPFRSFFFWSMRSDWDISMRWVKKKNYNLKSSMVVTLLMVRNNHQFHCRRRWCYCTHASTIYWILFWFSFQLFSYFRFCCGLFWIKNTISLRKTENIQVLRSQPLEKNCQRKHFCNYECYFILFLVYFYLIANVRWNCEI